MALDMVRSLPLELVPAPTGTEGSGGAGGFAGRRVPDGSGGASKESEGSKREKSSAESAWEKSDAMEVGTFDVEELGEGASW